MTFNISDLIKKKVSEKQLHLTFEMDTLSVGSENIEFSKPIDLVGNISSVGDIINFDGIITTELRFMCSRCTEVFNYELKTEIHEQFSSNVENKDEDIIFIDCDTIDITEIVESNIIMSLPIKKLCKEDCKGLCHYCGTDLNHSTCKCEEVDVDPRLAKLKELFSGD